MRRLTAVSGAGEKGPACFLVEAEGARLLLDMGAGPEPGRLPDLASLGPVDAVLLSHAHPDHAGALHLRPLIGNPPVYATAITAAQLRGVDLAGELPLGGESDICGLHVRCGRSGHAPGGVWLHIATGDGLLYMGDACTESALYVFDPPPPAGVVIVDGSYNGDDTPQSVRFAELEPVLAGDGELLLPAPASGRGPELALLAARLRDTQPWLCPVTRSIVSQLVGDWRALLHAGVEDELRRLLDDGDNPPAGRVAVAARPNCDGGAAQDLAREFDARGAGICLTGYVPRATPAGELLAAGRAMWKRLNVHSRLRDVVRIAGTCGARLLLPAFCPRDTLPLWQSALAPVNVSFGPHIDL